MLNEKELTSIVQATLNDPSNTYNSSSGAFLDIIRDLASKEKIEDIADAMKIYVGMYPQTAKFLAASLPAILSNCYFTVLEDFPFDKFIEWSTRSNEWSDRIKESYKNKDALVHSVKAIIEGVVHS